MFRKTLNFPNVCNDQLPALENKTSSQVVAENVNALHHATQYFAKSESSSKLKQALRDQTCTYSSVTYNTSDMVFYYNRKDNLNYRGPGTVIERDRQQVVTGCPVVF